jgi:uncharacterized protein (TIGR02599 family)
MLLPSKLRTTATDEACSEDGCPQGGFTLVEMLVAIVILALIMVMVLTITDQTSKLWKRSSSEIQAFQNARAAYDTMTMRLSQATLNTYLDYYNTSYQSRTAFMASTPSGTFTPTYYARNSDLDFVVDQATTLVPLDTTTTPAQTASCHPGHAVFFEAPLGYTTQTGTFGGLVNMLNACGYYVEFNTDKPYLPPFLSGTSVVQERYRYRLMEFLQPTENNTIYSSTSGTAWFTSALPPNFTLAQGAPIRMLAENIVALAILPEVSPQSGSTQLVTNSYTYDARAGNIVTNSLTHDQLPPLLRVVMVAIDEPSAIHLNPSGSNTPPTILSGLSLFKTTTSGNPSTDINTDLNTLTQTLASNKVNYRVFDTDVAIRGAKWSTQ